MKTIKKMVKTEFEEKKSKFIGYAKPISSKKEAEEFIEMIKEIHPDATHNCSVYKVIDNGQEYFKADDDGEPSGTAGKPMGEIITYMDLNNLVVVATRYFGGIKLGAGGLVRNYAKTAKLAILEAEIEEYIDRDEYILDFPYDKIKEVETILINKGDSLLDRDYNERVSFKVKISKDTLENLKEIKDMIIIKV